MNNIELQHLRRDTKKFLGDERESEIDKMNSFQLDALRAEIDKIKQETYPSHAELRQRKKAQRLERMNEFQGLVSSGREEQIKKQRKEQGVDLEPVKFDRTGKPSVLLITDVRDWAWWIKSHYLKKYLSNEFDINIINVIGPGASHEYREKNKYDIYFTFGYSYVNYIKGVPKNKRVSGVTAHRNRGIINAMNECGHVHANSLLLKKELENWGVSNVHYLPNGVDEEMFQEEIPIPVNENNITVCHVGKKSNRKGQDGFIFPSIKKSKVNQFLHLNDYTNSISHDEMPKLYQKFDVYICASHEDGTPNPALEAAACGRPILTNPIGNMPEFVKDGYNGFLVDKNINNYVEKIKWFKNHPDKMIEMGKNARKTVLENWTWKKQSENYRKMFRKILGM